jgi:predicted DNA-binding protein (UPF0251 family)
VRNNCYERLQHRGVPDHSAFDERIHSVGRSTTNPKTSLIEKENAELVMEALAELPLEYREVLVLRELEELSYLEIASITRIPLGTVMSRLSRARKRLQQRLLDLAACRNPDLQPSIAPDGSVATLMAPEIRLMTIPVTIVILRPIRTESFRMPSGHATDGWIPRRHQPGRLLAS